MATDYTTIIPGKFGAKGSPVRTCILDEGTITVTEGVYGQDGLYGRTFTFGSQLYAGDVVAMSNDTAGTFAACLGIPLVEKPVTTETLVVGIILDVPKFDTFPTVTTASDTLAERLAGRFYRKANVQFFAFNEIQKAVVYCDGSHATVQGVGATLQLNITASARDHKFSLIQVASGGVGVVPLHYVAAGSAGDLYDCLVGITGMLYAVTGA